MTIGCTARCKGSEIAVRDIHCHILPGVDDGARDLNESLAMWEAFEELKRHAGDFPLQMGFEVNVEKLKELGIDEWADRLHFDGSDEFLLELSTHAGQADFKEYERIIYDLQGRGYQVIVAHPERYKYIQKNIDAGTRLIELGCKLQASADFVKGGRFGREKKPARRMFADNMYSYIASDAHVPRHYEYLSQAVKCYQVRGRHLHRSPASRCARSSSSLRRPRRSWCGSARVPASPIRPRPATSRFVRTTASPSAPCSRSPVSPEIPSRTAR